MDEKQVRKPATPGPVVEGQLELNRELPRGASEASRDRLQQEQEQEQEQEQGAQAQPDVEPAVRSPFADAAVATRDPRSDAG
jgi:hypothetical protein